MKNRLLILFLFFSLNSFAQYGFRIIEKAEKQIEKGNYDKAMKLLEQADTADYGFCGNAWWDAQYEITMNKLKIYDAKNDNLSALMFLNKSQNPWYIDEDSLKMTYLIKVYSKEIIKAELDVFLENYEYSDDFEEEVKVNFGFFDELYIISNIYKIDFLARKEAQTNKELSTKELFRFFFREQSFYKLLTD